MAIETRYILWSAGRSGYYSPSWGVTSDIQKAYQFEYMSVADLSRLNQPDPDNWVIRPVAFDTEKRRIVETTKDIYNLLKQRKKEGAT